MKIEDIAILALTTLVIGIIFYLMKIEAEKKTWQEYSKHEKEELSKQKDLMKNKK